MTRNRLLISAVIVAVLVFLFYLQFRHWKTFDWHGFWRVTKDVLTTAHGISRIVFAILLIYFVDLLRAYRWKLFLKPVSPSASTVRLIGPQFIGFTGLALLGRPGELIRPYLIAKRENLNVSSQMAVWAVERLFDIGAVALLLGINVFFAFPQFRTAGVLLLLLTAALALFLFLVWLKASAIASLAERILSPVSERAAAVFCQRIRAFGEGLNTIHDLGSFVQLVLVSIVIWLAIAWAYVQIAHAYPPLEHLTISHLLLVMASSMAGSLVQLPGVGGGSQLAVISILSSPVFKVPQELAVSCGIMMWLVTFMAVVPVGLAFAHQEHVSLRKLSQESHVPDAAAEAAHTR